MSSDTDPDGDPRSDADSDDNPRSDVDVSDGVAARGGGGGGNDDTGEHSAEATDSPTSGVERPFVWNEAVDSSPSDVESDHVEADADSRHRLAPDRYLLAGETIVEQHEVNAGWVVVTTHRLLVFDPEADGKRFEAVARPNVVGVRATGGGSRTVRSYVWRAASYAVVLSGGGLLVRASGLQSLFAAPETGAPSVDGVLSLLSLVGTLVGLLAMLLFIAGGLAAVAALGLGAWYLRGREPTLVVERAGDDDVTLRLPATVDGERLVASIEGALADELEFAAERERAVGRSRSWPRSRR